MARPKVKGRRIGRSSKSHPNKDSSGTPTDAPFSVTPIAEPPQQPLPGCAQRLLQSSDYGEIEEACGDISFFALQPKQHAILVRSCVPQRLGSLLLQAPMDSNADTESGVAAASVHRGIVYMQVAAAEALRNVLTNSQKGCDEVMDALITYDADFSVHLVRAVVATWGLVSQAQQLTGPLEWSAVSAAEQELAQEEDNALEAAVVESSAHVDTTMATDVTPPPSHRPPRRPSASSTYLALLRLLEELLQLASVCIEAKERITAEFSNPEAVFVLLSILETTMTGAWTNLEDPLRYFDAAAGIDSVQDTAMRHYKQEETRLLAATACAASDALHTLSSDNAALSQLLSGNVAQKGFLNQVVEATALRRWLAAEPTTLSEACQAALQAGTAMPLAAQCVYYQLLRATLGVQGTLQNSVAVPASLSRVLPLGVDILQRVLPMQLWRETVPLLMEDCDVAEPIRAAAVHMASLRLRCVHAAVRLFSAAVDAICERNGTHDDDEVAFSRNPVATALYESNALYSFGVLLRDVLWLQQTNEAAAVEGSPVDVMRSRDQRLLRGAALSNTEVTTLQFTILSTEVAVWGVASTLLMMVPAVSLGDPASIWRAMVCAVQNRYNLLTAAALSEQQDEDVACGQPTNQDHSARAAYNIVTHSSAARQLVLMQLESLTQMLWTLQRKQSKQMGGVLQSMNALQAVPGDVDLLIRLSWESLVDGVPTLRQACVGAVGHLCCSLQTEEAITVATRYALAVLTRGGGNGSLVQPDPSQVVPLSELGESVVMTSAPTQKTTRQIWLASLSHVDVVVSTRVEAANVLMDLFLDERYDTSVYIPLQVHAALMQFAPQLKAYMKRRVQVAKELRKNYRLVVDAEDLLQWEEVEENLGGFLAYKASHIQ